MAQTPRTTPTSTPTASPGVSPDYERGRRDGLRTQSVPRMTGWRVACGICWAVWTVLLTVAAFASFANGSAAGILAFFGLAGTGLLV